MRAEIPSISRFFYENQYKGSLLAGYKVLCQPFRIKCFRCVGGNFIDGTMFLSTENRTFPVSDTSEMNQVAALFETLSSAERK